jgi:hypothetical protein
MMAGFGRHLTATAVGVVLGLLLIAWLQPNTAAGATMIVLVVVILANGLFAGITAFLPRARKAPPETDRQVGK